MLRIEKNLPFTIFREGGVVRSRNGKIHIPFFVMNPEPFRKVDGKISFLIKVYVNQSVKDDTSAILWFNIDKNTMKEFSDYDKISIKTFGDIDADKTHFSKNITGPFWIKLFRKVADEDIRNIKQDKMPGFRFSWKYSQEVDLWKKFNTLNNQFTRSAFLYAIASQ